MRRLVLVAALLSAAPSQAQLGRVLGWSKSGSSFAYLATVGDNESASQTLVVIDALTGRRQTTPLEGWVDESAPLKGQSEPIDAWVRKNPLFSEKPSRTSTDGKATAEVVLGSSTGSGAWSEGHWSSNGSAWQLSVTRDGKTRPAAFSAASSSVDVYFSPDGRRTAWVVHVASRGMRDPGSGEVMLATDGAPAVGIAIDKARLAEGAALAGTLDKAGHTVLSVTAAKKPRDATVVFAAEGKEADAKAIAALVPGATVAKLDWATPLDVVVAVGGPPAKPK